MCHSATLSICYKKRKTGKKSNNIDGLNPCVCNMVQNQQNLFYYPTMWKLSKVYVITNVCFIFRCIFVCFLWFYELLNEFKHSQCQQLFMEHSEHNSKKKKRQKKEKGTKLCCRWLKWQTPSLQRRHKWPPPLRQGLLCKRRRQRRVSNHSLLVCLSRADCCWLSVLKKSEQNNDTTSSAGGGRGNAAPDVFLLAFISLGGHSSCLT